MAGRQVRTLTVPESAQGHALAEFLGGALPHLEPERIQDLLARGAIWTGKYRCRDSRYRVTAGETVLACFPPSGAYDEPVLTAAMVRFEGDGLLVLDKPGGWYSQSTPWDLRGNLIGATERFLVARDGNVGFLHQVNRLDRETSGLILFARRRELASPLQAAWSGQQVDKRYLAVVVGRWEAEVLVDGPIASAGRARFHVHAKGKPAQTRFRPLAWGDGWTLVEANPLTGRTHQIRVHAAHQGHPLLGDSRYGGGRDARIPCEFFLHARQLSLDLKGRAYRWLASVPEPLAAFLATEPGALAAVDEA